MQRQLVSLFLAAAIVLVGIISAAASQTVPHRLISMTMEGDEQETSLRLVFDKPAKLDLRLLRNPERLVIDLPATAFDLDREAIQPRGLVQSIRYGAMSEDRSRMIIGVRGPFTLSPPRSNLTTDGENAVEIQLQLGQAEMFEQMLRRFTRPVDAIAISTPKQDRLNNRQSDSKLFTVVIDAGHGGIDTGARGRHGVPEKNITLAFARELRRQLETMDGVRVVLTRDDDRFIALDERVRIGRQAGADLFLSIHADSVRQSYVRGATVYTISKKASDAMAARLADSENAADAVAGIELPEENGNEVADILLDLTRRETKGFSLRFAGKLVESMQDVLNMINRPHRHAGFRVLTAPDVPSVLVELGYLSNNEDEKLLQEEAWRRKAAGAIAGAIDKYIDARRAALQ